MAVERPQEGSKLAYGHASHETFNAQLDKAPSVNHQHDPLTGPWISYEKTPDILREFAANSEPERNAMLRAQRLDMAKTEAERRREQSRGDKGEQTGNGGSQNQQRMSSMVQKGASKPSLTPPPHIRDPVDRQHFNEAWMLEKRDAALARADLKASLPERGQTHTLSQTHEPSR